MSILISQAVKEYVFPARSLASANLASVYTIHPINGRLLKVAVYTNTAGSLFIQVSGTGEFLVNGNGFASGIDPIIMYPRALITNNINTDLSGLSSNVWTERVVNTPLFYAGSGFTSGTDARISGISVYYV